MGARRQWGLRVAIVGATGAVGSQLLELIEERAFPHSELKLFSSEEHGGESIEAGGQTRPVEFPVGSGRTVGFAISSFVAVQRPPPKRSWAPTAGPIIVDLSAADAAARRHSFVAPGFTAREEVRELSGFRLFHTPHPAALALAIIINALGDVPFCAATVMLPRFVDGPRRDQPSGRAVGGPAQRQAGPASRGASGRLQHGAVSRRCGTGKGAGRPDDAGLSGLPRNWSCKPSRFRSCTAPRSPWVCPTPRAATPGRRRCAQRRGCCWLRTKNRPP